MCNKNKTRVYAAVIKNKSGENWSFVYFCTCTEVIKKALIRCRSYCCPLFSLFFGAIETSEKIDYSS